MKLTIDETKMEGGAIDWFWFLSPGSRGTYLQALWECEGKPGAKDAESDERRNDDRDTNQ
jgi:hypothetical protein